MILILPGNHVANLFQRTGCHAIVGRTPANQAIVISGDFKWESLTITIAGNSVTEIARV